MDGNEGESRSVLDHSFTSQTLEEARRSRTLDERQRPDMETMRSAVKEEEEGRRVAGKKEEEARMTLKEAKESSMVEEKGASGSLVSGENLGGSTRRKGEKVGMKGSEEERKKSNVDQQTCDQEEKVVEEKVLEDEKSPLEREERLEGMAKVNIRLGVTGFRLREFLEQLPPNLTKPLYIEKSDEYGQKRNCPSSPPF